MTRSIDNQETRDVEFERSIFVDDLCLRFQSIDWEVCGPNLLRDTTSFAFLDVRLPDLVEKFCLTGVNMAQDTADR